ncbi:MAG: flavodoxin family protein [Anaerolineae bacterium]
MAAIIGLVGSPRREQGLTHSLVNAVLEGAGRAGARVSIRYLVDWPLEHCTHCGSPCFAQGRCSQSEAANELSGLVNAADALVIGAPVYVWQINGLTHAFMDRYRIPGGATLARKPNGKPAVAIAVAGGTGTGVFGSLRSLVDFLCLWGYRVTEGLPATRYDIEAMMQAAERAGRELAEAAKAPRPFAGTAELLAYYDDPRFRYGDHTDEMIWLAEQALTAGYSDEAEIRRLCAEARATKDSEPLAAAEKAVAAFEMARGKL